MGKYCGNCGTQMAQDDKFCAVCGTKFESNVVAQETSKDNQLFNSNSKEVTEVLEQIKQREEAYLNKIQGSFIGGAIGDALGYPVEFLSYNDIKEKYGDQGITQYKVNRVSGKALISDDTQMTLFTANGLLYGQTRAKLRGIAGEPSSYVFRAYLNWLETQDYEVKFPHRMSWLMNVEELYDQRAPGRTCIEALTNCSSNGEYGSTTNIINQSKGCGGVMRVAPVGLFFERNNISSIDKDGAEIAAITHTHPLGYMPAALLTHIIHRCVYGGCIKGTSLLNIVEEGIQTVAEIYEDTEHIDELVNIVHRAILLLHNNNSDYENIKLLGEGWVAEEALAIALYCSLKYSTDFTKAIIASVNHDGDSDSTGAITGNIMGALLGISNIDDVWMQNLELKDIILEIATDVCHGCQMSEYSTYNDDVWCDKYIYAKYKKV